MRAKLPLIFGLLAISLVTQNPASHANVGEAYGFGSRAAGLGGAGVAWGFDGYGAYANPASLALTGEKRLTLSWGLLAMDPTFKPINGVVVENEYTTDRLTPRTDDVDVEYRTTLGQAIGLSYQVMPETFKLTAGLVAFLPLEQVAFFDTGEPYVPEYVLYRARTQRPQVELGLGAEPIDGLFVGLGAHVAFSLTGNATVFLQTKPDQPSTMRFSTSLKPKASPYLGLLWAPNSGYTGASARESEPAGSYSIGAVLRFPVASAANLTLNSGARAFGSLSALDFNFGAVSALFYDPASLELGGSWQYSDWGRAFVQVDYQLWKNFRSPTLSIVDPDVQPCDPSATTCPPSGIIINPSSNPSFPYRNILIPRLGHELTIGKTVWRAGYAYRPSFMSSVPTGAGNFLDPPKHMATLGVGIKFPKFLSFEVPCHLDFHVAYHHLLTQRITKTEGNEVGQGSGDRKIGAPGYLAGGKILGGGLSLTLAF